MRTIPFSHQSTGQAGATRERVARPQDPDPGLEQQQALLLKALRRAGGAPVSYSELKDAGIEFPASVVSELELAGVEIERASGSGPGSRREVGVRLARAADPDPVPVGAAAVSATDPAMPRAASGTPPIGRRVMALLALLAGAGVAVAAVMSALTAGGGARDHLARARYHPPATALGRVTTSRRVDHAVVTKPARRGTPAASPRSASRTSTRSTTATSTSTSTGSATTTSPSSPPATSSPAAQTPAVDASPASATDLEANGHELMVAGRYDQAVPVLRRALRATGEQAGACLDPTTESCLTYAFALYDLGRTLRLSGDPAAAVPILEHRLRIDNQRPVVAAELAQARQQESRPAG